MKVEAVIFLSFWGRDYRKVILKAAVVDCKDLNIYERIQDQDEDTVKAMYYSREQKGIDTNKN